MSAPPSTGHESDVTIVEVGPRDGLQNEPVIVSTEGKITLVDRLVAAGARRIEAVSFAHPKAVPAMADAEAVMAGIHRDPGASYIGLVLNRRGLDRAVAAQVDEVNSVVCVTDSFSERNQRMSSDAAMADAAEVIGAAHDAGLPTTLTLSVAFGCPFEGEVDPAVVGKYAALGAEAGVDEICLGDTIGVGVPSQVRTLTRVVRAAAGDIALRFHFHNTRNTGYANAATALDEGVYTLDASVGGIGGCPFAPAATGNIATEDLVYMVERMGFRTGYDIAALLPLADFLAGELHHEVPALLPRAGVFPAS